MSWMKRPDGGAPPPPGPDQPLYGAPQSYGSQQNMYTSYQSGNPNTQQQQYWQVPPQQQPQYNQQYGQVYQQQELAANANQYYQQPTQYNQNYDQGLSNTQQGYQQNYYPNQGAPHNYPQSKPNADSWEDNWDWGWEDSAKQAQKAAAQNTTQPPAPGPQQVFNNANVIEESFATTNSWNWSMEDKKEATKAPIASVPNTDPTKLPVQNTTVDNNPEHNIQPQSASSILSNVQSSDNVKTLNDRDIVKERLPNLALGKRLHLDNLTPQWSIESQMSQESSDGPHTHSEGTYRSENQSRNSSKSSPGLNTDNSNFNYSQSHIEELYPRNSEWTRHSIDESTLVDQLPSHNSRHDSHDELSSSLQEMSISNSENPAPDSLSKNNDMETKHLQENVSVLQQVPQSVSPVTLVSHASSIQMLESSPTLQMATGNLQPLHVASISPSSTNLPPPVSTGSLPPSHSSPSNLNPSAPASSLPPQSSTLPIAPPTNFPPPMSSQNPYKHAGPFSHKNMPKSSASNPSSMQSFSPQSGNTNLSSPSVVSKVAQHNRAAVGFGANLETTPDNSERPDQPQVAAFRPMPTTQQIPENLEVAPQNDRNEYLQTAHLSSGDFGENTDFSRSVPPPGLRRLVVGQQESEYTQNLNLTSDEPPPGLSRMVPGQQNETQGAYNQTGDNYMDRHIDGQPMDNSGRPYRQADGQQISDNYNQPPSSRNAERRPIGLDRMVPGEPSNNGYSQYQSSPYVGSNEQRVVTGVDHEYAISSEAGPADVREQIMDGSEYTEQTIRNPSRTVIGARESSDDTSPDFGSRSEDQQREVVMEGENLQDLSMISSVDLSYTREQTLEGADVGIGESGPDRVQARSEQAPESSEHSISGSRRQSLNHVNTSGEDSERDRLVKSSPRRDKHKSSRDRDKEGRYSSRGDRKYDRESERRSGRDDRRNDRDRRDRDWERAHERRRDESPESRRARRAARARDSPDQRRVTRDRDSPDQRRVTRDRDSPDQRRAARDRDSPDQRRVRRSARGTRYETEDTDYSDRERYQRRQREGSYTSSKPPRHDGDRRYREDREHRRYNTIERERDRDRDRERYADRDRYELKYRDIDPSRKYGNLRKEREDERKRGPAPSPTRAGPREATAAAAVADDDDDERGPRRRSDRRARHHRNDSYYTGYEAGVDGAAYAADPYALQRQYQYYEHLRLTDPAAYMRVYKQLLAGAPPDYRAAHMHYAYPDGVAYGNEERGGLHSGRSSAAGLKGDDTDLTTDASLNLHLEDSTVRSDRMTPFRYSTAHIKGSISSQHLVVVAAAYPVDGRPARVVLGSLAAALAHTPLAAQLAAYPGPLLKGVTHKKSVIEYCERRAREAAGGGGAPAEAEAEAGGGGDAVGRTLLWQLLALLLRQNGVVVGTDIAELLMKNAREIDYGKHSSKTDDECRREPSVSGSREDDEPGDSQEPVPELTPSEPQAQAQAAAVGRLRDLLTYGNRQEALEWAMNNSLWGHAMLLSWYSERRARAQVAARFVAGLPRDDPLHSLYSTLAAQPPPVATGALAAADWRAHAAMLLANPTPRPDHDRRTLLQLGDTLSARGLVHSAQFCYVCGGADWAPHPLAPLSPPAGPGRGPGRGPAPRLSLLLADPRARSLAHFATNEAIFATEIYEYALSLNQDYYIKDLQVYKLVLATRLADVGLYERALRYTERAARAVMRAPRDHAPALLRALAALADRLRPHDPAQQAAAPGGDSDSDGDGAPRPRWLDDVRAASDHLAAEASQQNTPQHQPHAAPAQPAPPAPPAPPAWQEQAHQQQPPQPASAHPDPPEEALDYSAQYYQPPDYGQRPQDYGLQAQDYGLQAQDYGLQAQDYGLQQQEYGAPPPEGERPGYGYDERQPYADPYWQGRDQPYGYGEAAAGAEAEAGAGAGQRPMITMPASKPGAGLYGDYDDDRPPSAEHADRETDTPKSSQKKAEGKPKEDKAKGGGWLGGFLTRLSLRPPNQMILPDDKNPTVSPPRAFDMPTLL